MTITCAEIDDLLFDGSPLAMAEAERHAKGCAACAASLAEWNDISATARSLRADAPGDLQSDLLWPRIERGLAAARRRSPARRFVRYAAAVLLAAFLGGTMFYALRLQTRVAAFDRDILRIAAVDEVEKAERAHVEAIARLEKLAEPRLEKAGTPLAAAYREKLMLLDDAIAECEANIENNQQNAYLREQLLSMYSDKQRTLQDVLREEKHVSN